MFLHAPPDAEAPQTAGTRARAAGEGHRVVTVFATGGEHGEVPDDLAPGETVVQRRRREAQDAADVLGVARIAWLGYVDSGMTGWEQNAHEGAFSAADLDEAGQRLADLLDEEGADLLVGYDWHGGYGHPDHVQVHRVAHRAAELAASPPRVLESTMNRDVVRAVFWAAREAGALKDDWDPDGPQDDGNPLGTPEAEIHLKVDVSEYLEQRRAALLAHRSQRTDTQALLGMPAEAFTAMFGTDHFLEPGRPPGVRVGWIVE